MYSYMKYFWRFMDRRKCVGRRIFSLINIVENICLLQVIRPNWIYWCIYNFWYYIVQERTCTKVQGLVFGTQPNILDSSYHICEKKVVLWCTYGALILSLSYEQKCDIVSQIYLYKFAFQEIWPHKPNHVVVVCKIVLTRLMYPKDYLFLEWKIEVFKKCLDIHCIVRNMQP